MENQKITFRNGEIEVFDEPEDVNETSSKYHRTRQLLVWESQNMNGDPKNAEAYEIEKREVIISVNNFMTKLYIDCQRFKKNDDDMTKTNKHNIIQEDRLTDQVEIAYNLITRLRQLLTMEKTDAIMERSLNRTNFFKINNDLEFRNEEKINNRQKALIDKQRKVNYLSEFIDSIVNRYNLIVEMINAPSDFKFLDECKMSIIPMELKKNITKNKNDIKKDDQCNKISNSTLESPMNILISRITEPEVKPNYRIIGTDITSYKTIYNYSCTLYGLYAEGKGSKKEKAKENAATEMIRLILNKQNDKTLPIKIKPFDEQEINDLHDLLKTKQNYTEFLEETI